MSRENQKIKKEQEEEKERNGENYSNLRISLFLVTLNRYFLSVDLALGRPVAGNSEAKREHDHQDPDQMAVKDARFDAHGVEAGEEGGREGAQAADLGQGDGVEGSEHGGAGRDVVDDQLDGGEGHADAASEGE